jgi:hypothetical protein
MTDTPEHSAVAVKSRTSPKDFFLWLGVLITLYSSLIAFFTLIFDYINTAFPDPLSYVSDPYGGAIRSAMATIIVFVPILLGLLVTIRRDIVREPGKANIWVRRWTLVFTIFLATATGAVTLIILINTFLGGEITTRFILKSLVVLLVAVLIALHFLADLWGYWTLHRRKANYVGAGAGALAIMTIIAGFLIIGSPKHIRDLRLDQQRVSDLQNIQYNVISYWQLKRELPPSLEQLNDPLVGGSTPVDPVTHQAYEYRATAPLRFELCATFAANSIPEAGSCGSYPSASCASPRGDLSADGALTHAAGHTCFSRTIDPQKYPPAPASESKGALRTQQ